MSFLTPGPETDSRQKCPFGYVWNDRYKRCVDTVAGVDRLTASTPTSFSPSLTPTQPMPANTLAGLDLGSLGGVAMTILNVLTVVGAVGGLIYVYKSGIIPGTK